MAASAIRTAFFLETIFSFEVKLSADEGKGFVDFLEKEFPHVDFRNEELRIELRVAFALGACFIGWEHAVSRFGHVDGQQIVFIEQLD